MAGKVTPSTGAPAAQKSGGVSPAKKGSPGGIGATVSTIIQYRVIKTPIYYLTLLLQLLRIMKKPIPGEYKYRVKYCPWYYGGQKTGWQSSVVATQEQLDTIYSDRTYYTEYRDLTKTEHREWNPQLYKDNKAK